MTEEQKKNYPIGLIVKILLILILPLILFRYVDSQPVVTLSEKDSATRDIAVVVEDSGTDIEDEEIVLGQEIASLLNEQEDYTWSVMNRSAAEQGFSQEVYDAVIYIPSNFSESVMTFKDDRPNKAAINYVVQPNLDAKNRQRVHKEMARAKSTINKEMSTIYWSVVSQEVDHIREHFDNILEKEIAFQKAMHAFYTPTSRQLAGEIEHHQTQLEQILDQTGSLHQTSSESAQSGNEAEKQMSSFVEALEAYKDAQQEQQQLLMKTQTERQDTFKTALDNYYETLQNDLDNREQNLQKLNESVVVMKQENKGLVGNINTNIRTGKSTIQDWLTWEHEYRPIYDHLNRTIIHTVNSSYEEMYDEVDKDIDQAVKKLKKAPTQSAFIEPIEPGEGEELSFDEIDKYVDELKDSVKVIKRIVSDLIPPEEPEQPEMPSPDPTDPETPEQPEDPKEEDTSEEPSENEASDGDEADEQVETMGQEEKEAEDVKADKPNETEEQEDSGASDESSENNDGNGDQEDDQTGEKEQEIPWEKIDQKIANIDTAIDQLKDVADGSTLDNWQEFAADWNEAYVELSKSQEEIMTYVLKEVDEKQENIIEYLPAKEESFASIKDRDKKDIESLITYSDSLKQFATILSQQDIQEEIVDNILDKNIDEKMEQLFTHVEEIYTKPLQPVFGIESIRVTTLKADMDSFDEQVDEVKKSFDDYQKLIAKERETSEQLLDELQNSAQEVTANLKEMNADTFEWEESPSLEVLDGQMIFQVQQGTVSDLQQLSELVDSLGESQQTVTSSTNDLQEKVSSVQSESDELNNRWTENVASTELVKDDVHDILGNTVVDGQANPIVYDYLSNPVQVEGKVEGQVLSEEDDRLPPVILFVIILVSGLLIGFLTDYYAKHSIVLQSALFLLLGGSVGLIISIYSLTIYPMDDAQAMKWSVMTIVLLLACASVVRGSLFIAPFVGWLASIGMIIFFVTPLIDIVVPEFNVNHPVANTYMALQFGSDKGFLGTTIVLLVITLIISIGIYAWKLKQDKTAGQQDEESVA